MKSVFPKGSLKNHLLLTYHLGFDWSGWKVQSLRRQRSGRSVLTNGKRPKCKAIDLKIIFPSIKLIFTRKVSAFSLVFTLKDFGTRQWPIERHTRNLKVPKLKSFLFRLFLLFTMLRTICFLSFLWNCQLRQLCHMHSTEWQTSMCVSIREGLSMASRLTLWLGRSELHQRVYYESEVL